MTSAPLDERRPNVAGDLRTVLESAPMFGRAVAGYDRFQVDSYVQWAEDELTAAAGENEDLLSRYAQARAELDEARRLLARSSGGTEFLRVSRRIGSMLAAAADQAEGLRADAQAEREAAADQAGRLLAEAAAEAQAALDRAADQAERVLAEADRTRADATRLLAEAERAARDARAEADARCEEAGAVERRAAEEAERVRRSAADEASAERLRARDEAVRLLTAAREQRLRSDAEAAACRERLDREAAARRAALLAEVAELERRRSALVRKLRRTAEPAGEAVAEAPVAATRPHRGGGRRSWLLSGARAGQLLHLGRRNAT